MTNEESLRQQIVFSANETATKLAASTRDSSDPEYAIESYTKIFDAVAHRMLAFSLGNLVPAPERKAA